MTPDRKRPDSLARQLFGSGVQPAWGVVLGSGFGAWVARVEGPRTVPYGEVPGVPLPGIAGHEGRFVGGRVGETTVVMAAGRVHLYEGYAAREVVRIVEVLAGLGIHSLLLTTAVGAVSPGLGGDTGLCVADQINLTGEDPAAGSGTFPDASALYDPEYRRRLAAEGLPEVVLAGLRGPSYETPAEARALRALGADAVCMSTVLEALAASSLGLRTAAVAVAANRAGAAGVNHASVVGKVEAAADRLWAPVARLICGG